MTRRCMKWGFLRTSIKWISLCTYLSSFHICRIVTRWVLAWSKSLRSSSWLRQAWRIYVYLKVYKLQCIYSIRMQYTIHKKLEYPCSPWSNVSYSGNSSFEDAEKRPQSERLPLSNPAVYLRTYMYKNLPKALTIRPFIEILICFFFVFFFF